MNNDTATANDGATASDGEILLNRGELANRVGCTRQRLASLAVLRLGPPYQIVKNRAVYKLSDVENWEKHRTHTRPLVEPPFENDGYCTRKIMAQILQTVGYHYTEGTLQVYNCRIGPPLQRLYKGSMFYNILATLQWAQQRQLTRWRKEDKKNPPEVPNQ